MNSTKERILNESLSLFLQKSFKEVTMNEIAEKTGLSKGAIYHYFDSKEQLFIEIINNTFSVTMMDLNYNKFSKNLLYQFYHDYINYLTKSLNKQNKTENSDIINLSYLTLILDALKYFPDFKDKLIEFLEKELTFWIEIVHTARNKGEIESTMSDEEIARMFIYSSNGVGFYNFTFKGTSSNIQNTLLKMWDSFYEELKA